MTHLKNIKNKLFFRYWTKEYIPDHRAVIEFDTKEDTRIFKKWFNLVGQYEFLKWLETEHIVDIKNLEREQGPKGSAK